MTTTRPFARARATEANPWGQLKTGCHPGGTWCSCTGHSYRVFSRVGCWEPCDFVAEYTSSTVLLQPWYGQRWLVCLRYRLMTVCRGRGSLVTALPGATGPGRLRPSPSPEGLPG